MSRYNDAATAGAATMDSWRCHAHGCPLPGAISDSTRGGGLWFCRFHFGTEPAEWPKITEGIQRDRRDAMGDYLPAGEESAW